MRSDAVRKGMQQAPHRSLFNALGMTEEEMNKPLVGIVSSYNEIVPGHMNLDKIVEAVKLGVAMDEIGEVLRLVFFYYGASAIIPAVELFEELEEG